MLTLIVGCGTSHTTDGPTDESAGSRADGGDTARDDASAQHGDADVVPADADSMQSDAGMAAEGGPAPVDPDCKWQWGWVGEPSPHGLLTIDFGKPLLAIPPDRVEAITTDGRTISCDLGANGRKPSAGYSCEDEAGLAAITVHIGAQSWTRDFSAPGVHCSWPVEDSQNFWLEDVAPCVALDSVVLEGELLGYDPDSAPPPSVYLVGPRESFADYDRHLLVQGRPQIACSVTGRHYKCTSIGYRRTVQYEVFVNGVAVTSVSLPVKDCTVEPVVLAIEGN